MPATIFVEQTILLANFIELQLGQQNSPCAWMVRVKSNEQMFGMVVKSTIEKSRFPLAQLHLISIWCFRLHSRTIDFGDRETKQ
jgi:hypothetical protein